MSSIFLSLEIHRYRICNLESLEKPVPYITLAFYIRGGNLKVICPFSLSVHTIWVLSLVLICSRRNMHKQAGIMLKKAKHLIILLCWRWRV